MFLIRGYQEDSQETIAPGTIFDTTLPIWRLGEALLHAARLTSLLATDPGRGFVHFRAQYSGLLGRRLTDWANPLGGYGAFGGHVSRSDEAVLETTIEAAAIERGLDRIVHPLAAALYERFGAADLPREFVAAEIAKLRKRG
jgi:hypothetical protein